MGAIGSMESIHFLEKYLHDDNVSVRETAELAIDRIKWDNSEEGKRHLKETEAVDFVPTYTSIDPAPPTSGLLSGAPKPQDLSHANIDALKSKLLNTSIPLFDRYRAMFALRNIGNAEAVDALAAGFADDSALFKHEIAFVFGQLLSPHSIPCLVKVLDDNNESEMVRHEAAEALGGIATPEVLPHLREWLKREDAPRVVRESCQVALDMYEVRPIFQPFHACVYVLVVRELGPVPVCQCARDCPSGCLKSLYIKRVVRGHRQETHADQV